ncbi:MAG: ribonuclease Z [Saprospiraceae bacterium]|nr:ribonuclease Z [Saprospiraceae bacterium]
MNTGKFELQLLGCSAALPAFNRLPSAQVLNIHEKLFLIDCGEGTQFQLKKYGIRKSRIDHIFISHLHGDHVFGLPGLITSYNLMDRKEDLNIYAPQGIEEMITQILSFSSGELHYKICFHNITDFQGKIIFEDEHVKVKSLPLNHKIPTSGFLFEEKLARRKLNLQAINELGISKEYWKQIEEGFDISLSDHSKISNSQLVLDQQKTRKYAYCSDTRYELSLIPYLKNISLLYHETTYLDELSLKAQDNGHSTAIQAAKIALAANVKTLLTGHYSSRYEKLDPILKECQSIFENTILGTEGLIIKVDS